MVVSTLAMHMAMAQFLFGCITHILDVHIEMKGNTGQWVVPVQYHESFLNADDCEHAHFAAIFIACLELHAKLDRLITKTVGWDFMHQGRIKITVSLGSGYYCLYTVASLFAFELAFQSRYDHTLTLDVRERLTPFAGIQQFAIWIIEGVMEGDNGILLDLHGKFKIAGTL